MSSYGMPYRPRRKNLLPGVRRFANRAAMLAQAAATRNVATQRRAGRPPKSLYSGTKMSGGSATRTAQGTSTQTGGSNTITMTKRSSKTKDYKARPRLVNAVANTILKASIKTIPQIYQRMHELSTGHGINTMDNSTLASGGYVPLHAYCLTTIDRPNADNGNTLPFFYMNQATQFAQFSTPVVFGNSSGIAAQQVDPFASASKLFLASLKVRMLFWSRIHKETTYQIQVIRFKKPLYHMNPFVTPDEELSLSALSAEQLAERKAFWIDFQLRKHTVNPVAVSQNLSSRFKKYIEVLYDKSVTISEQESSFDEQNNELITMTLPVNRFMQFNHDVDTRYSEQTDAERADGTLNTNVTDLADVKHYHKAAVNHNLWLIIRANNATLTGTGGEDTTEGHAAPPYVPSYDISFQANYKVLDAQ